MYLKLLCPKKLYLYFKHIPLADCGTLDFEFSNQDILLVSQHS